MGTRNLMRIHRAMTPLQARHTSASVQAARRRIHVEVTHDGVRHRPNPKRWFSSESNTKTSTASQSEEMHERNIRLASYALAAAIGALGASYASVPLYKMFCQATGFGGTTQRVTLVDDTRTDSTDAGTGTNSSESGRGFHTWTDSDQITKLSSLHPVKDGPLLRISFDTTVSSTLPWSFRPAQTSIRVVPGETALCFFTTANCTTQKHLGPPRAITGVATYNVHPPRAGLYFNKVQCFCFEEQRLLPGETVDMPVFFYIDPKWVDDPVLKRCNNITLSYTFFQTDEDYDDDEDEDEDGNHNSGKEVKAKAA